MRKEEEWITIVPEKSKVDKNISDWFGWEKAIDGKRAVPFRSKPSKIWFEGKVNRKDALHMLLVIPTGITLSYKGKEWAEETNLEIELPFDVAGKLAEDIIKCLKRNVRGVTVLE